MKGDKEPDNSESSVFHELAKSPWRFKLYLLKNLPMAFLAGLRIKHYDSEKAAVSVSLGYLTKNPFRSIYFACLAMAAELSTGLHAMRAVETSGRRFSFLVVNMEAAFTKKAVGTVTFECKEGSKFAQTINRCLDQHEAREVNVLSTGKDEEDVIVASFKITWSFKPK